MFRETGPQPVRVCVCVYIYIEKALEDPPSRRRKHLWNCFSLLLHSLPPSALFTPLVPVPLFHVGTAPVPGSFVPLAAWHPVPHRASGFHGTSTLQDPWSPPPVKAQACPSALLFSRSKGFERGEFHFFGGN